MDSKHKMQSLAQLRRKKQAKLQKDEEHLNKISEARNLFLKTQNVTPDIYTEQNNYLTTIQVNV